MSFKKVRDSAGFEAQSCKKLSCVAAYYHAECSMWCAFALYVSVLGIVCIELSKINTDPTLAWRPDIRRQVKQFWWFWRFPTLFAVGALIGSIVMYNEMVEIYYLANFPHSSPEDCEWKHFEDDVNNPAHFFNSCLHWVLWGILLLVLFTNYAMFY
eukprot:UN29929